MKDWVRDPLHEPHLFHIELGRQSKLYRRATLYSQGIHQLCDLGRTRKDLQELKLVGQGLLD